LKYALLFKAQIQDGDILYRVHLTYQPNNTTKNTVDHTNVLPLEYTTTASDTKHSSLSDLFNNGKTVLLNIKQDYKRLTDPTRQDGVSTAGLILNQTDINNYIGTGGGWLYIDIAQDTKATGSYQNSNRNLYAVVYMDIDRNSQSYKKYQQRYCPNY